MGNSHKNLLLRNHWANCNQTFLWEFPIGFYVKLSSAVAAILVGGMKCRTQFWKGTTQGSFQQSLVEIVKWPKLLYLSQNVPKFELYKHNDELFNIYYRIFYEL
jgi:hypothetical protein